MLKNFFSRIQSRKFLVLIIAVGCFFLRPQFFNGDHLLWVFAIYVGGNLGVHITDALKEKKGGKK